MKGIFNWNVKQLFLYLTAEYSTKNNVSLSWAFDYCKNQQISCTFFPKIFTRNWGCSLFAGTFEKGVIDVNANVH